MDRRTLFVDTGEGFADAEPNVLRNSGYEIDLATTAEEANKLLNERKYGAMVIEPFNPRFLERKNPLIKIMHSAKERDIPIIVSSTQSVENLAALFGIMPRHCYQEFAERPYGTKEVLVPILERALGSECERAVSL